MATGHQLVPINVDILFPPSSHPISISAPYFASSNHNLRKLQCGSFLKFWHPNIIHMKKIRFSLDYPAIFWYSNDYGNPHKFHQLACGKRSHFPFENCPLILALPIKKGAVPQKNVRFIEFTRGYPAKWPIEMNCNTSLS